MNQKPHPNAHILKRLAEIAQEDAQPWKRFEYQFIDGTWKQCGADFLFTSEYANVRERILNPVEINGKMLGGPFSEPPALGQKYWMLFDAYSLPKQWGGLPHEEVWLKAGRIFHTKEARDAMQKELTKTLTGAAE